jgi:hypothetical protein
MNNNELREAIKKIARIKMYKEEESILREKIKQELKTRGKIKINLGGPESEDYVKLNISNVAVYSPDDLFNYLIDYYKRDLWRAGSELARMCCVSAKSIDEYFGNGSAGRLIRPSRFSEREQISYRISSDKGNAVRGIDL